MKDSTQRNITKTHPSYKVCRPENYAALWTKHVKHGCLTRVNPCQQVAAAVAGARTAIAATLPRRDTVVVWIVLQTFLLPVCVEHKAALRLKRNACIRRKSAHARLSQRASQTFQIEAQRSSNKNMLSKWCTRYRNWTLGLGSSPRDNKDTFECCYPELILRFHVAGRE